MGRTISWLLALRRLTVRYDRSATAITAVAILAITVICPLATVTEGLLKPLLGMGKCSG